MKLFKTPQAINLWKIFSFLILFMVIDTVTAFFGLGIVLILKYFKLVSLFNAPTLILLELIIRYGLAFILFIWVNRFYMKQRVFLSQYFPLKTKRILYYSQSS